MSQKSKAVEVAVEVRGWTIVANGTYCGNPKFKLKSPLSGKFPEIELIVIARGHGRMVGRLEYEILVRNEGYLGVVNRLYTRVDGKWRYGGSLLNDLRRTSPGRRVYQIHQVELPEKVRSRMEKRSGEVMKSLPFPLRPGRLVETLEREFGDRLG